MPRGVRQTTAMYIRSQTIIFSPISDNRVCVVQPLATGALAERVLSQHGTPGLRQSRHVPSPSPHHQPPAVGDSNLPGTQVSHN